MARVFKMLIVIIGLLCLLGLVQGFLIEPGNVVVRHATVTGTSLAGVLKGERVVVVSDLHLSGGDLSGNELLAILADLSPDYLLLLGDYVRWGGDYQPALAFLSKLAVVHGAYGILGDYDHHDSRQSCLFCHEPGRGTATVRHPVHFLMNRAVFVHGENGVFRVVGLDGVPGAEVQIAEDDVPTLVLGHDPLLFDEFSGDEGVLMLAGDTHGGQVPLPSFVWRLLGYEKNARYNSGWFKKGSNQLFITRGVGTSHVPFRLFCPPEVVVLHFE